MGPEARAGQRGVGRDGQCCHLNAKNKYNKRNDTENDDENNAHANDNNNNANDKNNDRIRRIVTKTIMMTEGKNDNNNTCAMSDAPGGGWTWGTASWNGVGKLGRANAAEEEHGEMEMDAKETRTTLFDPQGMNE